MQLTIEIPNQPLYDNILWFLNKFKDDGLKIVTTSLEESKVDNFKTLNKNLELDPYFYKRQERLVKLRDNIESGDVSLVDFDTSMDELVKELQS